MNEAFRLRLEKAGLKASFYKIHFDSCDRSEYDRFLDRLEANRKCTADQRNFCKWHHACLGDFGDLDEEWLEGDWLDRCWKDYEECKRPEECDEEERCQYPILCQQLYKCQKPNMLDHLQVKLLTATQRVCFHEDLFRPEDNYPENIRSIYAGAIRLYGVRWGKGIFIAGDGGYKTEKKIYQDDDLGDRYDRVKYVKNRLTQKIAAQEIVVGDSGRKLLPGPRAPSSPLLFESTD